MPALQDEDWDEVQEKIDVHNADIEDINDRWIAEINAQVSPAIGTRAPPPHTDTQTHIHRHAHIHTA